MLFKGGANAHFSINNLQPSRFPFCMIWSLSQGLFPHLTFFLPSLSTVSEQQFICFGKLLTFYLSFRFIAEFVLLGSYKSLLMRMH